LNVFIDMELFAGDEDQKAVRDFLKGVLKGCCNDTDVGY